MHLKPHKYRSHCPVRWQSSRRLKNSDSSNCIQWLLLPSPSENMNCKHTHTHTLSEEEIKSPNNGFWTFIAVVVVLMVKIYSWLSFNVNVMLSKNRQKSIYIFWSLFSCYFLLLLVEPECQGDPQERKQNPADAEGHECYHPR